jgi:hypothetical protein
MNKKTVPLDYTNSLIFDLQKAFWDERGRGARFRMTLVGREIYESQVKPLIKEKDSDHILSVIEKTLIENGIVAEINYSKEDQTLRITVKGCLHLPVEERMAAYGIEPFTCIPANLFVMAIEEQLDRQVEIAEIKSDQGLCELLLVIFDRPVSKFQL